MSRGRRPSGRRGMQRMVSTQMRQLRRELNGYVPRGGPNDPPVLNLRPYYSLTISVDMAEPGNETILDISTIIKAVGVQLGLSPQDYSNLVVRLRKIQGWAYQYGATTDRISINGEVSSLVPNISDLATQTTVNPSIAYPVLYKFKDYGSLNKPAHFAYVWPRSQQEIGLQSFSNFVVATLASNTKDSTVHVSLEWTTSGVSAAIPDD